MPQIQIIRRALQKLSWQRFHTTPDSEYWAHQHRYEAIRVSNHLPWPPGSHEIKGKPVILMIFLTEDHGECKPGPTLQFYEQKIRSVEIGQNASDQETANFLRELLLQMEK